MIGSMFLLPSNQGSTNLDENPRFRMVEMKLSS